MDLAQELKRRGYVVEFVLMRARGEFMGEAEAAFVVVDLGVHRARSVPRALIRYLRKRRPDALLVAMWPLTALAGLGAMFSGHRCRVVVAEHSNLSSQYKSWGKVHGLFMQISMAIGYRLAHARLGVSAGVVNDIARLARMKPDRFQAIHNPIPIRRAPSSIALAEAEALWRCPRGARILTVGSFKAQKNHALLLRAISLLPDAMDAQFMLLGRGEGEAALRTLAVDLGISHRVIFAGFWTDPTPFYMTADVFVLSSDYEGFGNVIVEALAVGTPVVSTNCPSGPAEILVDGKYGRLVPVRDAEALAAAIVESLAETPDRDLLKSRARDFSVEKAADRYLALLFSDQHNMAS